MFVTEISLNLEVYKWLCDSIVVCQNIAMNWSYNEIIK